MNLEEHPIHKGLKNKIVKILTNSGFKTDSEVHVSFSTSYDDDFSLDVTAIHDDSLLLIECKKSDKDLKRQIEHTLSNAPKIPKGRITKLLKHDGNLCLTDLKKIKQIRYCYAINDTQGKNDKIKTELEKNGILFWNNEAIKYFYDSSKILGSAMKYEILREFGIKPSAVDRHPENAVRLEQNGQEIFLLGIHPSRLLKMAYAFRRTSFRDMSYQRIISGSKLDQLRDFYKKNTDFLLANSVIIAFDHDKDIQKSIHWDDEDKQLQFPMSYCCAWIIDGQHRVFAFKDTKYSKQSEHESDKFKIPVVAFRKLPLDIQSRTFVNINYYQNKIKTILICDLASSFPDANYELSWVSLLVKKMNEDPTWNGMIQTSQNEPAGSISIAGFVRPVFLFKLLGYDSKTERYSGPLFKIARFDKKKSMTKGKNKTAFDAQLKILNDFFACAKKNSWNAEAKKLIWDDHDTYGLSGTWCVNALLLVLSAILEKHKSAPASFDKYLQVLREIDFSKTKISGMPRGYGAITMIAQEILNAIHAKTGELLTLK